MTYDISGVDTGEIRSRPRGGGAERTRDRSHTRGRWEGIQPASKWLSVWAQIRVGISRCLSVSVSLSPTACLIRGLIKQEGRQAAAGRVARLVQHATGYKHSVRSCLLFSCSLSPADCFSPPSPP